MELTDYSRAIKQELSMELAKQGSSIEEFEEALKNINTGEGVLKVAALGGGIMDYLGKAVGAAGALPETALKLSAGGGAAAGLALDEMDKSVDTLNKALEREREKINLVRRLTSNLKREHGLS